MCKWLFKVLFSIALQFIVVANYALESGYTITVGAPDSMSDEFPNIISTTNFVGVNLKSQTEGFGVTYSITNSQTNEIVFEGKSILQPGEIVKTIGNIQTGKLSLKYNENNDSVNSTFEMNASNGTYHIVVNDLHIKHHGQTTLSRVSNETRTLK